MPIKGYSLKGLKTISSPMIYSNTSLEYRSLTSVFLLIFFSQWIYILSMIGIAIIWLFHRGGSLCKFEREFQKVSDEVKV